MVRLWTSLVVPRLRICLPMQGTQVQSLVQEDAICHGAAQHICETAEPG